MTNHKVIDIMQNLNTDTDSQQNRVKSPKKYSHRDNIHLTDAGYCKLAENILTTAIAKESPRPLLQGTTKGLEQTSWQGFITTSGYGAASKFHPSSNNWARGGRHHPYRR